MNPRLGQFAQKLGFFPKFCHFLAPVRRKCNSFQDVKIGTFDKTLF